ncbi:MAG TPA: hypothetical protein VH016_09905, partial [Actinomycetota bacterium]|nr:hypothetical protein [Actinomycetota bacterium]
MLFGSWPGYGHLLPMVPLIRAAQQGGHDVVVSSGADMSGLIGRLGVTAHRSGVTLAESYDRMPDHATISELPAEQQPGFAARHLFGAGAVDRARDLLDLLQTWRPDLIVHDTLELGSPTVAALHQIPHVTHGYGPMVPNTSHFAAAIAAAISDAGLPDPIHDIFAAPYLDVCPPSLRGTEPNPWTTIHPLRPSPGEVEPHAAVELDLSALPHPDTVYLTLGTIMNQTPRVFRAVIDGCVRWPVNLVVTTGPGFAARHLFGAGAVDRAHDLLDLLQRWRPDLIVHDTLELGSPTAAAVHGIPHITHGYGPMVPSTSYFAAAIGGAISDAGLPDPVAD